MKPPVGKTTIVHRVLLAVAVSVSLGLAEWIVRGEVWIGHPQLDANRALLAIVTLYGLAGTALGMVAAVIGRRHGEVGAIALPPALLAAGAVALRGWSWLTLAAVAALGFLVYRVLCRVLLRYGLPRRPRLWWSGSALLLAAALAMSASGAPDRTGFVVALTVPAVSIALLVGARRSGALAATVLTLIGSAVLATREPTIRPDVRATGTRPSVLLITLDTLRADHVGAYGYARARTPHLDRLSARGVLFRETVAPTIETGPSHASILTGLRPETHGVLMNKMRLDGTVETVAGILRGEGYVTAAFLSSMTTSDRFCGLPSRFHFFDDNFCDPDWLPSWAYTGSALLRLARAGLRSRGFKLPGHLRRGEATVDLAIEWLERQQSRPFFVWVHLFDPHLPYRPPPAATPGDVSGQWYDLSREQKAAIVADPDKVQRLIDLYDAEVTYTDAQVGRIFESAERLASDEGLLTVIAGDHGESMGEHGIYWARDLYDPSLLVPFIIVPHAASGLSGPLTVEAQVRLIDIAPTVLDLIEVGSAVPMEGTSLVGLIRAEDGQGPGAAYSAIYRTFERATRQRFSIRKRGWKLIRRAPGWAGVAWLGQSEELYELGADPDELNDLVDSGPAVLDELRQELALHESPAEVELELTDKERAALRSLGYLD